MLNSDQPQISLSSTQLKEVGASLMKRVKIQTPVSVPMDGQAKTATSRQHLVGQQWQAVSTVARVWKGCVAALMAGLVWTVEYQVRSAGQRVSGSAGQ